MTRSTTPPQQVVPSPMLRALQTAAPIAAALGCPCQVSPLVFETGGMYARLAADPERGGGGGGGAGGFEYRAGLTAGEIEALFAGFGTRFMPVVGPMECI